MVALFLAGLVLVPVRAGDAERKPPSKSATAKDALVRIKPTKQWGGVLKDNSLRTVTASGILTRQQYFDGVWREWRSGEQVPRIDFVKNLVVVVTADGASSVEAIAQLDSQGDLKVSSRSEAATGTGFGYQLAVVSRQGIKTFAGKRVNCGRYGCDCHLSYLYNPDNVETRALHQKLQGVCWGDLAQYECFKDDPNVHKRMLNAAFADASQSNKIVFYVANTGG
jgi:hypothetical protein